MNVEMLGVNFVETTIARCDYATPVFNRNDKEPSWDGFIEVYEKAGNTHPKEDLIIKIPVQIKGHKTDNLRKKTIPYSVDVSDLNNYLIADGTMFFVVYIDSEGENHKIYYEELLPFDLKKKLKECKPGQKSKTLHLKPFPKRKADISNVLLNFAKDMKKQKAAIESDPITLGSIQTLAEKLQIQELSFEYTDIRNGPKNPFEYMFDNRAYIYATLPLGIKVPIEKIDRIESASTVVNVPIIVGTKQYYDEYTKVFSKKGVEGRFGKAVKLITENGKPDLFSFSMHGTFFEQLRDVPFVVDALTNMEFYVGEKRIQLHENEGDVVIEKTIDKWKKRLEFLKKVQVVLKRLNLENTDFDFEKLNAEDHKNLRLLVDAFCDNKEVYLKDVNTRCGIVSVSNIRVLVVLLPGSGQDMYVMEDAFAHPPTFKSMTEDGVEFDSTIFATFNRKDLANVSNINYDKMYREITGAPICPDYCGLVTNQILELLHAFDESKDNNVQMLDLAEELNQWLLCVDIWTPREILEINCLQIKKRKEQLNAEDMERIISIAYADNVGDDIRTAAFLLINNQKLASFYYNKMEEDDRLLFREYPVFRFWKGNYQ